jgi:hypothetical protein
MGRKKVVEKPDYSQNRDEYGMRVAELTYEKFDGTLEAQMMCKIAAREVMLDQLKELERLFTGHAKAFTLAQLVQTILALRSLSLDVLDAVKSWRTRLVHREPPRWREKDGSYTNYLLKMNRDTERHLKSFDLGHMVGITFR